MLNLQEIPVAGSTRKTYLSALDKLDEWLKGREVNDENLSAYLSYLFDRGKSPVCGNTTPATAQVLEAVVKKYMAHHKTALVKNAEVVRYALKEYLEHGES